MKRRNFLCSGLAVLGSPPLLVQLALGEERPQLGVDPSCGKDRTVFPPSPSGDVITFAAYPPLCFHAHYWELGFQEVPPVLDSQYSPLIMNPRRQVLYARGTWNYQSGCWAQVARLLATETDIALAGTKGPILKGRGALETFSGTARMVGEHRIWQYEMTIAVSRDK